MSNDTTYARKLFWMARGIPELLITPKARRTPDIANTRERLLLCTGYLGSGLEFSRAAATGLKFCVASRDLYKILSERKAYHESSLFPYLLYLESKPGALHFLLHLLTGSNPSPNVSTLTLFLTVPLPPGFFPPTGLFIPSYCLVKSRGFPCVLWEREWQSHGSCRSTLQRLLSWLSSELSAVLRLGCGFSLQLPGPPQLIMGSLRAGTEAEV